MAALSLTMIARLPHVAVPTVRVGGVTAKVRLSYHIWLQRRCLDETDWAQPSLLLRCHHRTFCSHSTTACTYTICPSDTNNGASSVCAHLSDKVSAVLAVVDHLARKRECVTVKDVLECMIKAHRVQGGLARLNSFNPIGLNDIILMKVASTVVVSKLLELLRSQTIDTISQAWVDGQLPAHANPGQQGLGMCDVPATCVRSG
ncbi:MmgE/PrpD family-domain-containing protein [Russula aff. rugulosa BPL654]|nr:MmgE/PrpD family-domain-containing protein [Russula aff. rugulosa BPL654]